MFDRDKLKEFLKDRKVLPTEGCITQHKPMISDLKKRKVKDNSRNVVLRREIRKPHLSE